MMRCICDLAAYGLMNMGNLLMNGTFDDGG
jgi:hypothetical protein